MNTIVLLWLIAALFFLIFEMGNPGLFFFISFCMGALSTAIASAWVDSLVVQWTLFLSVSFISFFILRVFVMRWLKPTRAERHTNVYALEGKHGVVVTAIEPGRSGLVKVGGEVWSARAVDQSSIGVDTPVIIITVSGVHLVVRKAS